MDFFCECGMLCPAVLDYVNQSAVSRWGGGVGGNIIHFSSSSHIFPPYCISAN